MRVSVTIGATRAHRLQLPPVSGLSVQADSYDDGSVTGTFSDPYKQPIPSTSEIYVVYVNSAGQVLGGDSESAGAAVTPGNSVGFGFDSYSSTINDSFVPASDIASVDGSVDPCDGLLGSTCPAEVPGR